MSSAASASFTAVDPKIDRLKFNYAELQYSPDQARDWKTLESVGVDNGANNITDVVISDKQVFLRQKFPKGAGSCTLTIARENLSEPKFQVRQIPGTHFSIFELSFKVNSKPVLEYGRTMQGTTDLHGPTDFPLSRHLQSFRYLKLCMPESRLANHTNKSHQWYETLLLRLIANVSTSDPGTNPSTSVPGTNLATPDPDQTH